MLPLVLPGVATVAIFAFLASWNEFLAALILLTDQNKYTLPVLMAAVRSGQFGTIDWGAVQSGVTLMMAPCLAALPPPAALLHPRPRPRAPSSDPHHDSNERTDDP